MLYCAILWYNIVYENAQSLPRIIKISTEITGVKRFWTRVRRSKIEMIQWWQTSRKIREKVISQYHLQTTKAGQPTKNHKEMEQKVYEGRKVKE